MAELIPMKVEITIDSSIMEEITRKFRDLEVRLQALEDVVGAIMRPPAGWRAHRAIVEAFENAVATMVRLSNIEKSSEES